MYHTFKCIILYNLLNDLNKLNGNWDILLLGANLKKANVKYNKNLNLGELHGGECHGCLYFLRCINRR